MKGKKVIDEQRVTERQWTRRNVLIAVALMHLSVPVLLAGQTSVATPLRPSTPPEDISASSAMVNSAATNLSNAQNPFLGSVPQKPIPGIFPLSLRDAIDRGLNYNLGVVFATHSERQAEGARLNALSKLLPNISARVIGTEQQINLAALGLPTNAFRGIPTVVGPFSVFDARALLSQRVVDLESLYRLRSNSEDRRATQNNYTNARDMVVLVVGGLYLQAVSQAARIDSVRAQLQTAQALYRQSADMKSAGVAAGIDVLRSQVEMQVQQQRLLAVQNEYEKQKLILLRAIGLPTSQEFTFADKIPFQPAPPLTLDEGLARALRSRADYRAAQNLLRAAELARKAAVAERLPSLALNGDYGVIGPEPGNSHGTFTAAAALNIPVFQGGKAHADTVQADALMQQRGSALQDLRGRIELEVRTAFLDLNTAADQVAVAHSSVQLATQQVTEARDRYTAGVVNTVEVVQAQEALATAEENYISSVFAHNLAKLSLARALGVAEEATKNYLGGK